MRPLTIYTDLNQVPGVYYLIKNESCIFYSDSTCRNSIQRNLK